MSNTQAENTAIKPCKGYVLVSPLDLQHSAAFSVAQADDTPRLALVLTVGAKTYHTSGAEYLVPCVVGDSIIHSGFGFEQIKHEGKDYRLVPFDKILAVVEPSK